MPAVFFVFTFPCPYFLKPEKEAPKRDDKIVSILIVLISCSKTRTCPRQQQGQNGHAEQEAEEFVNNFVQGENGNPFFPDRCLSYSGFPQEALQR